MNITQTVDIANRTARVQAAGDLDYVTTRGVVETVSRLLVEQPDLAEIRIDCSELDFCDSAGLSGLLQIHRQTSAAGVQLHLDDPPSHLERLLQITGTLEHFTAAGDAASDASDEQNA
ncbi:STAS domain-containing protein [Mycobacterium sp. 1274761.0]|uniref:STAS domain-containing protein n=1 Tax=Mycobacterium sp. 1274761.0 TaxID=1834077 RepID=UPI0007FF3E15|nr:STAS domain-containing protein [Mycobacterium sp. 1274761.0]OBK72885.1 anti-anti-sigma factor [Mycobacterium sp. 1274761.0]